ncbi:unnamed protein product [Somion occarium]|uniref:Major facilitator superfamily (MFS) profile domain-containing protein n=1 Tax=Somion occarium TaxID=3059160 RepID=A0ABP1DA25_9APHY
MHLDLSSVFPVWLPHICFEPNSSGTYMSSCGRFWGPIACTTHLYTNVRCDILRCYIRIHDWRLARQLIRQRPHGPIWEEGYRGSVLTQFAIVIGIMTTQAMGLRLATTRTWRWVLVASSFLSAVQLILGLWMVESPTYLARHKMTKQGAVVAHRLWGATAPVIARQEDNDESVADPLLEHSASDVEDQKHKGRDDAITVPQLLKASNLRTPLMIACFSMLCQQLSGVNAVLYYSNDILSKALPDFGPYVSLGITIVNVIMTFPPIFLIERIGRKKLLSLSAIGALISLWGVGFGLDSGYVTLASLTIITFIASFAIGIGPVPFVMIPEVSPPHAVSALSSVGLSLNWIANFLVGLVFLPLRNLLAHGDASKEGRVFYVFASMLAFCSLVLLSIYRE